MSIKAVTLAGIAAGLLATPALAHHSFSMFDFTKITTYEVTVKDFEWANPHAWLHVMVTEEDGKAYEWALEMGSINQIASGGWKQDSVKPGDKITVVVAPLKDGSRGGSYRSGTLANGQKVSNNGNRVNDTAQ